LKKVFGEPIKAKHIILNFYGIRNEEKKKLTMFTKYQS
jgi:hypothetical protein